MKPIALICNRFQDGFNHFDRNEIDKIIQSQNRIYLKDGREVIIITKIEHARGYEFSGFWVASPYEGTNKLIEEVEKRVR